MRIHRFHEQTRLAQPVDRRIFAHRREVMADSLS